MANIHQLIAAINPSLYHKVSDDVLDKAKAMQEFKDMVKKEGIQAAAEKASPSSLAEHQLVYDSSSETLEPIYFFILDLMNDFRLSPQKVVDNFSSSPGGGYFAEIGQRATIMQQNATRILGDVNSVTKSVLNLLYDLKDFKMRLQSYDDLKSKDKDKKEAALLTLKQIWLDKVDISRGNSSLKGLGLTGGFQTILHAFLAVENESLKGKDGKEIDLNDSIKRILKPRIQEFNIWVAESERELRKRYEIEKNYLKSQVANLKLYSRWAKPYLNAARGLEAGFNPREPAVVNSFDTVLLELTLFGKSKIDIQNAIEEKIFPQEFKKMKFKRNYNSCIVISFKFRGIPQKISQQSHYVFGGRAEITFTAYALNDDEIKTLNKELDKSDLVDIFKMMDDSSNESISKMQEEIDEFVKEDEKKEEKKKEKSKDMSNPFLALLGYYNTPAEKKDNSKKTSDKDKNKDALPASDDYIEKNLLRKLAIDNAKETAFTLFDIYKKAHLMPSYT
ncbi:MAG TPA: hypothetical protein PLK34_01175 [Candidatus Pacearchaeota archaeon]|nr:hypothetical protein [Candidatus Pacearchaeota archaeon]